MAAHELENSLTNQEVIGDNSQVDKILTQYKELPDNQQILDGLNDEASTHNLPMITEQNQEVDLTKYSTVAVRLDMFMAINEIAETGYQTKRDTINLIVRLGLESYEAKKKGFDFKKFAQTLDEVTALRLEKVDLLARIDKLNAEIDHEISIRINELNARYQGENESLHLAVKFARSENEKLNTEYFELKARYQELTAKYQTLANQPGPQSEGLNIDKVSTELTEFVKREIPISIFHKIDWTQFQNSITKIIK